MLICTGIAESGINSVVMAIVGLISGTAFSVLCFNKVLFGKGKCFFVFNDINRREFIIIFSCLGLSILIGIFPELVLSNIRLSVMALCLI